MFFRETLRGIPLPDPASAAPPGRTPPAPYPPLCRMALRLSGLRDPPVSPYTQARQAQRRRAMTTGTALLLCRAAAHALPGIRFVRPAVNLFTIVAETAGADGLKIAETFPEGRGSLQARQAQRRRAVRFRARGGAGWRHKCLIRPTGSHHPGPHRSLRQRRANVAYTGVTLASFASRVPR